MRIVFLVKHLSGLYILNFDVGPFYFRLFTDAGELFFYIGLKTKKVHLRLRLSTAGCYWSFDRYERELKDENT